MGSHVLSFQLEIKMRAPLLLLFLTGCLALERIPLYRMKSARRTLEEMTISRSVIARRWLTDRRDFPEEPLENYLDAPVCHLSNLGDCLQNTQQVRQHQVQHLQAQ